jgi:hypothetical protein
VRRDKKNTVGKMAWITMTIIAVLICLGKDIRIDNEMVYTINHVKRGLRPLKVLSEYAAGKTCL